MPKEFIFADTSFQFFIIADTLRADRNFQTLIETLLYYNFSF